MSNKIIFCTFSVQEFMTFTSALIAERTSVGTRASVKEQGKTDSDSKFIYITLY